MLIAVMYGVIEERIGGGKTSFWNKGLVEQRLVIDSFGLPRDESVQIVRRGRCCVRGGAGALSFDWDRFPGGHGGRCRLQRCKSTNKTKAGDEKTAKNWVEEKK